MSGRPTRGHGAWMVSLLIAPAFGGVVMAMPAALAAQQAEAPVAASASCWHGRPLPMCGGFWLVEAQGAVPVRVAGVPPDAFPARLEWNLGYMMNLSPDWATGGAISFGSGATAALSGLRLRVRRWLGPRLSLEMQGGLVRTGGGSGVGHGISADVRLNVADQGSVFIRWDAAPMPERRAGLYGDVHPAGLGRALHLGVGTGSTCTLFATGLLGVMYVAALSAMGASP